MKYYLRSLNNLIKIITTLQFLNKAWIIWHRLRKLSRLVVLFWHNLWFIWWQKVLHYFDITSITSVAANMHIYGIHCIFWRSLALIPPSLRYQWLLCKFQTFWLNPIQFMKVFWFEFQMLSHFYSSFIYLISLKAVMMTFFAIIH